MSRRLSLLFLLVVAAVSPRALRAQSAADSAAIRATALDYIDGWYAGDAARMERALHPELAKRIVMTDPQGRSRLGQQSAMTLVQNTARGGGKDTPADKRKDEVRILTEAVSDPGLETEADLLKRLQKILDTTYEDPLEQVMAKAEAGWIVTQLTVAGKDVPDVSKLGL